MYKYIYRNKKNGMRIKTNEKLAGDKFELIIEYRDTKLKEEKIITK